MPRGKRLPAQVINSSAYTTLDKYDCMPYGNRGRYDVSIILVTVLNGGMPVPSRDSSSDTTA